MGLFRSLMRALFGGRRSRPTQIYRKTERRIVRVIAPAPNIPQQAGPNIIVAGITIVSSVSGPCYVVDGDTIRIGNTAIRLAGIDAPEMDHPYGKNAKWALVDLCKGQVITAEMADHFSYERNVATCFLPDGRDLSAEMVKLGFALDWRKFSGGKYRHLEPAGVRRKLWRCDARQRGQMPPAKVN